MKKKETSPLDEAIKNALSELAGYEADGDEYQKIVDNVTKLHALKVAEKPCGVSRDTLAIVAGNIAVALIIVGHERAHVVTSKVANFLIKRF